MRGRAVLSILVLSSILLAGCDSKPGSDANRFASNGEGEHEEAERATNTPTPTPSATSTVTPTPPPTATATPEPSATPTPRPPATATSTSTQRPNPIVSAPTPTTAPAGDRAGCDPSYPTVCIPPKPPDLACKDVSAKRFTVLPPDPHGFDGDKDGIGCE